MSLNSVLITGGAGFVGSHLCLLLKKTFPKARVIAFDNLKRRGSELNLVRFKSAGIEFVHGDIRNPGDFLNLKGPFDLLIEASAEPSVLAGYRPGESAHYALHTNLTGTIHCLEWAAQNVKQIWFLSTSRVYSIAALQTLPLEKQGNRLELQAELSRKIMGCTPKGLNEKFPTQGARSIYGTSKLASELLVEEYCQSYKIPSIINRCGVICGPWQWGKLDQGVFSLWMARHTYKNEQTSLSYTGFGGEGLQVRDLLHPEDLFQLLLKQLEKPQLWTGQSYNAGGGIKNSVSLKELTALCEKISGNRLNIGSNQATSPVDVPYYVSDNSKVSEAFDWQPQRDLNAMFQEIHHWMTENRSTLEPLFN